jgi:hypothetical protein
MGVTRRPPGLGAVVALVLAATAPDPVAAGPPAGGGRPGGDVRVEQVGERFSVRASAAPLRDVAAAFERRTTVTFRLARPGLGDHPVVADIVAQPIEPTMRTLLRGFSYVIDAGPRGPVVMVMARAGGAPRPVEAPIVAAEPPAPPQGAEDLARRYHAGRVTQVLAMRAGPLGDPGDEGLNELVGVADGRASAAIVAETRADRLAGRVESVRRLWRHAADLRFAADASIRALEDLAYDPDEAVASVARSALADGRAFLGRGAEAP